VIEKKLVVDYGDQKSMIQNFLGSVWKKISYIPKKKKPSHGPSFNFHHWSNNWKKLIPAQKHLVANWKKIGC
jgi:hypothetical protein